MKIFIESSPLKTGHQHRGIGMYTKQLITALKNEGQQVVVDKAKSSDADIVHYPYFDLFAHTLPIKASQRTVVTIHDVIPLEFPQFYKPGIRGSINLLLQETSLRFIDAIITDSNYSKQQIIDNLRVNKNKVYVVPLAGNPELTSQIATSKPKLQEQFKLPEKYVLYVGDINYNKNLPELVRSISLLPADIHLVLVGKNFYEHNIPEWSAIIGQVNDHHLTDRVHFVNTITGDDPAELAGIYKYALCYVQPSLSEGFGLPVLEAMQCHTPVICADRGSLPEIGGERALYADPNAESFAADIEDINSWNSQERNTFVSKAVKWAAKFSWQKSAQETIRVYQQVIS